MRKKYDLVVSTGTYESKGETKKRWLTIGSVMESDKGPFLFLDPWINLAALPHKEGDSVLVSCFEPKEKDKETIPF